MCRAFVAGARQEGEQEGEEGDQEGEEHEEEAGRPPAYQGQLEKDINMDEEAELRRLESGAGPRRGGAAQGRGPMVRRALGAATKRRWR